MTDLKGVEKLLAAKQILKNVLNKSRELSFEIKETGARLEKRGECLEFLKPAIQDVASSCSLYEIKLRVNRAVGPIIGVLKIFDLVNELQGLLHSDPWVDFFGYIGNVKRMEEALQLLSANCGLAVLWMEDLVRFLQGKIVVDDYYLSHSLRLLKELKESEKCRHLREVVLMDALKKLENEFRLLLTEEDRFPSPHVIEKVQAIIERFSANDGMRKCVGVYVEVRSSIVRTALQAIDLDYLCQSLSVKKSIQGIDGCIDQWGNNLEILLKDLEVEHRLCEQIFQEAEDDVWMGCFGMISLQSGICDFIRFGEAVVRGKKEAVKMLNLLEIFTVLDKVRLDFNRLFNVKACLEIQYQTRELIKKVVTCISEIFWDLSVQVEMQMILRPPADGSLPRMVTFVIEFCNQILKDKYMSVLIRVLEIHRVWNRESFNDESIPLEVSNIIKNLEVNLGVWAGTYKDTAISDFFLMNCHWYLCRLLVQTLVAPYKGFVQKYIPFMETEEDSSFYVKYTATSLQNKITSLFQHRQ